MKTVADYDDDSDGSSVIEIEPPVKKPRRVNSTKSDLISVKPLEEVSGKKNRLNSTKSKQNASADQLKPKEIPEEKETQLGEKPPKPKRGRCAYFLWLVENRPLIKKPGMSIAGAKWNKLKNKSKWEKAAEEDAERYQREMEEEFKCLQKKCGVEPVGTEKSKSSASDKASKSVEDAKPACKVDQKYAEHWAEEYGADTFDPLVPTAAKPTGLVPLSQACCPDLEQLLWKFGMTWINKQQHTRVWLLENAYKYIQEHPDDIERISSAVEPRQLVPEGSEDPLVPTPSKGLLPLSQLSGVDLHWLLQKLSLPVLNGKLYAS